MNNKTEEKRRDKLNIYYWYYRIGQMISELGDSCGSIALAWWVLKIENSPTKLATIIAIVTFTKTSLLPLFGPFGDILPRKTLIIVSDIIRTILYLILGILSYIEYFNYPLILGIFFLLSCCEAMFRSVSTSIVPQLIEKHQIPTAMRYTYMIRTISKISGGIAGGIFVTFLGLSGAFFANAISFFISVIAVALIKANTTPATTKKKNKLTFTSWRNDLIEGFVFIFRVKILLHLVLVLILMNFLVSPIPILLPILAKQLHNMPPWFLGALYSSLGIGGILGASMLGKILKNLKKDQIILLGMTIIAVSLTLLGPLIHLTPYISLLLIGSFGLGLTIANITIGSVESTALPDNYRSRIDSSTDFMSRIITPLGILIFGNLYDSLGLTPISIGMGVVFFMITCCVPFIHNFKLFFRSSTDELTSFFSLHYPRAFEMEKDQGNDIRSATHL